MPPLQRSSSDKGPPNHTMEKDDISANNGSAEKLSPDSDLFEAIENKMWDAAISIAKSHPEEASRWVVASELGKPEHLLALHYACSNGAPVEVVKELIKADPGAIRSADQGGRTLLHWAADHPDSSAAVFDDILEHYPDNARMREHVYGCIPLHVACCRKTTSGDGDKNASYVVGRLLEAFPEGALCRDKRKGWLPLHVAARNGVPPAIIEALTVACPTAAAIGDDDQRLPLHYISRYANRWNGDQLEKVLTTIVTCYPAGLKRRETVRGQTPLAIACSAPHPPETKRLLISLLLKHGQAAVSIPDFDQSLPVHIASRSKESFEVMRDLLAANPLTAKEQDKHGRTPLHWAIQNNASKEVIDMLLRSFPSGAGLAENKYGFTPLAVALHQGAEVPVISSLLSSHPEACLIKDKHGSLPIHTACKKLSQNSPISIEMLATAYPESTKIRERNGRTPVDLVEQCPNNELRFAVLKILSEVVSASAER
mmetsp:Transcript_15749/g.29842  ORF Transcript_15749/g.29842 Transcript_15749/m.29842 type:complete len:485 (-) Transcript_15749:112-1566(-)